MENGLLLARFCCAFSVFGLDSPVFCAVSRISIGEGKQQASSCQRSVRTSGGSHATYTENNFLFSVFKLAQNPWDYEPLFP